MEASHTVGQELHHRREIGIQGRQNVESFATRFLNSQMVWHPSCSSLNRYWY